MSRILHVALAMIIAPLLWVACSTPPPADEEPLAAPPRAGSKVIVIGVDGLEWRVIYRLMAEGRLPNLSKFFARGVRGPLETLIPTYSPVIWATAATGKLPDKHGITGFVTRDESGRRLPFTSGALRAAPLWQIAGDGGLRSAVVGWWTTWPAQPLEGVLISDRMLYNRFNLWFGLERSGADLPAQTYPEEWVERLSDLTRREPELEQAFFERFSANGEPFELKADLHDPWYELFLVYARDRAYFKMVQ
jgi:predicted AlkP superfamily pyrophosphatase or phosphodiesterase